MDMVYELEAQGDVETVGKRLEDAVQARKFGVMVSVASARTATGRLSHT